MHKIIISSFLLAFGMVVFWGCGKDEDENNGPITVSLTAYGETETDFYEDSYGGSGGGCGMTRASGPFIPDTVRVWWSLDKYDSLAFSSTTTDKKKILFFFSGLNTTLSIDSAFLKFYMIDRGLINYDCKLVLNGIEFKQDDEFVACDSIIYDSLMILINPVASGYLEIDVTEYIQEHIAEGFATFIISPQTLVDDSVYDYGACIFLRSHTPQLILYSR